jgi:predicted small secreted protein
MAAMMMEETQVSRWTRRILIMLLALACLQLGGCSSNVGVGLSVGVPIGNHGYVSVGGGRWL